eukprot:14298309-Alexandrium_andersonii.AAC.1
MFSSQVTTKGAGDAYNLRAFGRVTPSLGHDKLTLHTDGENPTTDLARQAQKEQGAIRILFRASPRGSPQSNGAVERAGQSATGL